MLVEKNKTYVEAAKSIGYNDIRIIFGHILPNCVSTLLVQLTLDVASAILDLAAMSFLGLGVQAPQSDWGAMLEEGRIYLYCNEYHSYYIKYFCRWCSEIFKSYGAKTSFL